MLWDNGNSLTQTIIDLENAERRFTAGEPVCRAVSGGTPYIQQRVCQHELCAGELEA